MKEILRFLATEKGKKFILLVLGSLIVIGGVAWSYGLDQSTTHQANQAKTAKLEQDMQNA